MSLATPPSFGRPQPLRWTGREFDRASESGVFGDRHVELINGEILEIPPMNDPHAQSVRLANYALLKPFPPDRATISIQCPMRLGESRPLPDLVVVAGTPRQVVGHPTTAMLIVEVSDTTLEFDQVDKSQLYAMHGIPEYWIIDINGRRVEVRRKPIGIGSKTAKYDELQLYADTQSISPLSAPDAMIAVAELLP
jgi:Uma2 family endonuclease